MADDPPVSLAARRADKAGDCRLWSVRDMLVELLADIDSGKIKPTMAVVAMRKDRNPDDPPNAYRLDHYSAGGTNLELNGLLVSVHHHFFLHSENG